MTVSSSITVITGKRYLLMTNGRNPRLVKRFGDPEPAYAAAAQANGLARQRGEPSTRHVEVETVQERRDRVRHAIDEIRHK